MDQDICSQYVFQVAFQTMKERCQQLQIRLSTVEEENIRLRQQYERRNSIAILKLDGKSENIIQIQQEKIEELKKQKSQLAHHIFMVSLENQQLWKGLIQLIKTNKSFDNQIIKISDRLKQHSSLEIPTGLTYSLKEIPEIFRDTINDKYNLSINDEKKYNLEEVFINSIIVDKSELEKQYNKIMELQTNTELNLKNVGFTYPEDIFTDSLEQLKHYDMKLVQLQEELLIQQNKLKNVLHNLKKMKKNESCNNCKNNIEKLMCQTGTQFDLNCNFKKNGATQTSISSCNFTPEKKNETSEDNICPLCGVIYKKSVSFELFHKHVVNHFNTEITDIFKIMT